MLFTTGVTDMGIRYNPNPEQYQLDHTGHKSVYFSPTNMVEFDGRAEAMIFAANKVSEGWTVKADSRISSKGWPTVTVFWGA